jgi:hypothetical protein
MSSLKSLYLLTPDHFTGIVMVGFNHSIGATINRIEKEMIVIPLKKGKLPASSGRPDNR